MRSARAYVLAFCLAAALVVAVVVGLVGAKGNGTQSGRGETTPVAQQAIAAAWRDVRMGDYSLAQRKFENLRLNDQRSPSDRLQAVYGLGMVAALGATPDLAEARKCFEQVIASDSAGELAPWAALAIARLPYINVGSAASPPAGEMEAGYRRVIERYPNSAAADEAFVFLQGLRLTAHQPESARLVVREVGERLKDGRSRLKSALYALRATAYRQLGDPVAQLQDAIAAVEHRETDPDNPSVADPTALYSIAVTAQYDVGDFATARRFYARFLKEAPADQRCFTVELLLKEMEAKERELLRELLRELSREPSRDPRVPGAAAEAAP